MKDDNFILFESFDLNFEIPKQLVSVYTKEIHPLAKLASEQLQIYITECAKVDENFKLNHGNDTKKIGKMFGILVVENKKGELGFLQAFSGKLGNSNHHDTFVPPVFDLLDPDNFFNQGMSEITILTNEINEFKTSSGFISSKNRFDLVSTEIKEKLNALRDEKAKLKQERKMIRLNAKSDLSLEDYHKLETGLAKESIISKSNFKQLEMDLKLKLEVESNRFNGRADKLKKLVEFRKFKSSNLQQQLFDEYKFFNRNKETKLLRTIFNDPKGTKMPAGAGECSAPKLFQYAFVHNYKPIVLAEFWWGKSPKSDNKIHKHFYPPCTDKCVPILGFMLDE